MGAQTFSEGVGRGAGAFPTLFGGETEFRRLLDKLPAGAYTCDPQGLITYFNEHAVKVWGRAPKLNDPSDRFCGSLKLFAADGSPLNHDQCWMALALKNEKGYNGEEIIVERPDGRRLTVLAYANPVHDDSGKLQGAVNVLVDIDERKQAERAMAESEHKLEIAYRLAKLGSWRLDIASGVLESSDSCKEKFGRRPEEEFSYEDFMAAIHPDDRETVRVNSARAIANHTDYEAEFRTVWPDGSLHWIVARGRCIYDGRDNPHHMVGVTLDVTDLKLAEEARRRQELERALEKQMLEERQRIGRELHDGFRQQLLGISMLSSTLLKNLKARAAPEAELMHEFTKLLGDANNQLRGIIHNLTPANIDAGALVPSLQRASTSVMQWYGVPCLVHDNLDALCIGDEAANHLFHIAQEAMINAAKHSNAPQIEVFLRTKGSKLVLEVRDDGDGLPADYDKRGSAGIVGMRHRAELIGADLKFSANGSAGTAVICTLAL